MRVGLLLLVSSVFMILPAALGMNALLVASSLLSLSSLFAAFILVVSSGAIAVFLQLAVLSLTRWWARRPAPSVPAMIAISAPANHAEPFVPESPAFPSPALLVAPPASVALAPPRVALAQPAPSPVALTSSVMPAPSPVAPVAPASSVTPATVPVAPAPLGRRSLRLVPFLLAALALLPGCAQAPAAQAAVPATCGSAAPDQVVVTAALQDGKASPAPHRVSVPLGGQVRLGVSADVAAQIHVHGYDLEYQVQPGQPTCIVFVASQSGLFDVEAHPDTLLLQFEVK